jgi:flagellar biosynthesis/type III secretory pathway M-ring protein FliF/YscJ
LGFTGQHCEHDICAACQKQGGTCIPTNSTIDCQQPIQTQNNSHSKVEELYSEFIAEASQSLQVEANILRMIIYVLSVMLFICLLLIVVIFLARRLNCNYKRSAGSKLHQLTLKFTNNQDEDRQFVINDNPEFLDQEEEERILSDV